MRKTALRIPAVAAMLLLSGSALAGESYTLDSAHTYIGFAVRHMGVSNVRGEFREYSAEFTVNEAELAASSIELRIAAKSIDTRNEQRDDHLRSEDFLEVEAHPEIVFKSKKIVKTGDGAFQATGDFTLHGVTKEVVLELEVAGPIKDPFGNMRLGVEGGLTIDRQDYGVRWSKSLDSGGLVVADNVKISFSLEASRKVDG